MKIFNYHITNNCNFHCSYCFGKFNCKESPSLTEAKNVINAIKDYFDEKNILNGRINLAGGEPLTYFHIDEIIDYISSLGIKVSIVTNGYYLTPQRINKWKDKVCCVGISIDSISNDTNHKIGRYSLSGNYMNSARLIEIADALHKSNIDLKINTVVSKFNICEDLTEVYNILKPQKIKLFKMHIIKGINDAAAINGISSKEFNNYCDKYTSLPFNIVKEGEGEMENSYLMISPKSEVLINDSGKYHKFGICTERPLSEILSNIPFDYRKFMNRYTGKEILR